MSTVNLHVLASSCNTTDARFTAKDSKDQDLLRAVIPQALNSAHTGNAGSDDGVTHNSQVNRSVRLMVGKVVVVLDGIELFVTEHAQMVDGDWEGEQRGHGVDHAEATAEDRDDVEAGGRDGLGGVSVSKGRFALD
jgi:hypothetical protein